MSSRRQGGGSSVSSRQRQSTTTPAPSRTRNETATPASTTATAASRGATNFALPPYQTPAAPLTADAQQALAAILTRSHPVNKINDHLKRASAALEESTSEINERLAERDLIIQRRKAKRTKADVEDADLDEKENADLETMRTKVEAMTTRLDTAMRKCVDGETGLENLEKTLKELSRSAANAAQTASQHQSTQRSQSRRNNNPTDEDEQPDESTPEVTQPGTAPSQLHPPSTLPPPPSLTPAFTSTLQSHTDNYTSLSLRARYSQHPTYVSFKKLTWDAQHPGDEVPPMPHASTWFAAEERAAAAAEPPAPGVTSTNPAASASDDDAADDDDIAVARVRISTRCPITMREFEDPVTSTKCAHSFERAAILDMLSAQRPPTRARGQPAPPPSWTPAVQCPVAGCSVALGRDDLVADKVLVARIRRVQRARDMSGVMGSDAVEGDEEGGAVDVVDGDEEGEEEEVDEIVDDEDDEMEEVEEEEEE